jgi:hypothetical protein
MKMNHRGTEAQRKTLSNSFFVLMLNIWLAGCGAVNFPQAVDPATTIRGMNLAINGMPGAYVLQLGDQFVFGWPAGQQYAWVVFTENGQVAEALKTLCGSKACPEFAGDVYNYLVKSGWKDVPAGAIPPAIASTVRTYAYLLSIGARLPMLPVLMMPVTIDPMRMMNPEIQS